MAQTLFDKLWESHRVTQISDEEDLIAIDRVFLHERTGAATLNALVNQNREPFDPSRVFCVVDHIVSNDENRNHDSARSPNGEDFIRSVRKAAKKFNLTLIDSDDPRQGITHVIAPELGLALPGLTIICPDSHTCSLGALGALAWGVGSSAAEHAIATGTLRLRRPRQMRITIDGQLQRPATAKDLALFIIAKFGAKGAKRCAIEFTGPAIERMSLEERLTLCNLAVEFSAFTAIIAPDKEIIDYFSNRPMGPSATTLPQAQSYWASLKSDPGAPYDEEFFIDASDVKPMISWGTSPQHTAPANAKTGDSDYMGVNAGQKIAGTPIDGAFIGSCTNGRLSDLRHAAQYLRGKTIANHVRAICVPGSQKVKAMAEQEGIDQIFKDAGFEWGTAGCALCFYAGGKTFPKGARVISSTNRNFESRQGPGVRTHLASPATVAASAVAGVIVDIASIDS